MVFLGIGIIPILIFLLVSSSVMASEWRPQSFVDTVKPVAEKCIQNTGVDPSLINDAREGTLPDDTESMEKYLLCIFETFDLIDRVHHEFEYWKILTMVPPEMKKIVFEMGKGCTHISGENYAKASYDFIKCLHKIDPKKFAYMF